MMAYTGMDMTGAGQNQWYKSQADASGMNTDQYDAVEAFELYMKNGSNFKAAGTDTVQGASATRYEGVITSDMLEDTLEESGSLESITSLLGLQQRAGRHERHSHHHLDQRRGLACEVCL